MVYAHIQQHKYPLGRGAIRIYDDQRLSHIKSMVLPDVSEKWGLNAVTPVNSNTSQG